MVKRAALFVAGLFMLVVFGLGAIISLPIFAAALAWFLVSGSAGAREFVGFKGKSLDQVCNAVFCGGHPKETISSHAGRWLVALDEGRVDRVPAWVRVVDAVTNLAEKDHCRRAVEEPFRDVPL